jgi:hypothetical protein
VLKINAHAAFLELQSSRINHLKATIADLSYSAANETKSTAGDKHETALAHLQTAIAQANHQLQELNNQYNLLKSIDAAAVTNIVGQGSLVVTNRNILYISAAMGKIIIDEKIVIAMSLSSPLGIKLNGRKVKDAVKVNDMIYEIEAIF